MSVVTLGFAVDSSGLVGATKALNDMTAAAKPAAQAASDLSKASANSATGLAASSKAAKESASSHAGLSSQAQAASHSIRSMVEQLASGVPPTQALTNQMNHLSYAASGPGGLSAAFGQAVGAFRGFISPTTAIVASIAAIGVGSLAAVNSVAKLAQQFDDTARAAGTTIGQLQGFAAAASFKGISNTDFLTAMDKFAKSVYDAKNNMGGLADVLTANHKSAGNLIQDFGSISDLIKSAAGNTQLQFAILSQSGLPATMQWVRFLSQGKDTIAAQATEYTKNGAQMDSLAAKARDFSQAWDKAITNLKFGLQGATLSGASWLDGLSDAGTRALMKFNTAMHNAVPSVFTPDQTGNNLLRNALSDKAAGYQVGSKLTNNSSVDAFYSPLGQGAPGNSVLKPPADKNALQHEIQLYTPCLGMLGTAKSVTEQSQNKPPKQQNDNDRNCDRKAA